MATRVIVLDADGFKQYLKKTGRSQSKIEFDVRTMRTFEEHLKHKDRKLEEAAPEDLEAFVQWAEETGNKVWLWVFNRYYSYTQDDAMFCATNELLGIQKSQ